MFYTSVVRRGSNLLVRGYKNNIPYKDKVDFQPTLYVKSQNKSKYKTFLTNEYLEPVNPGTMYDCKVFLDTYKEVQGFEIHGQTDYVNQYISTKYTKDVLWDYSKLKIVALDIETETEFGYPNMQLANEVIQLITVADIQNKKTITFGIHPYAKPGVEYHHYDTEKGLLIGFLAYWKSNYPDVITGWNTEFFDIPYLVKRIEVVLGVNYVVQLSPWSYVDQKKQYNNGTEETTYDIVGIEHLDYLYVYKKFTYKSRASYKLDSIAEAELGENKLSYSEYDSFKAFYSGKPISNKDGNELQADAYMLEKIKNELNRRQIIF